jgi:uncharacterized protein YecE (DUF72 family)
VRSEEEPLLLLATRHSLLTTPYSLLTTHMCDIRIGTSGWHYKHWVGTFYPERLPASKMLEFYLRHFDAVEINNTFYKLPRVDMLRAWRDAVPADFRFAVKGSRFITHNKKLKDPENAIENILPRAVEGLGPKLGPVLWQLPPKWKQNLERLDAFLAILPPELRYAFEFRHESWVTAEALQVLRRYNAAFCIYELAGYQSPIEVTADWTYVRLHGPGGKYQGSYPRATLRRWADRIAAWSADLKQIHVYFDNDQAGYAARNALTLKELVAERMARRRAA